MSLLTMELLKNNWAIRLGYFGSDRIPVQTNICSLFWRCIFRVVGGASILAVLGHFIMYFYVFPMVLLFILVIISLVVCVFFLGAGYEIAHDKIMESQSFSPILYYI